MLILFPSLDVLGCPGIHKFILIILLLEERYSRFLVSGLAHGGAMTLCKTQGRQTIAAFFAPRGRARGLLSNEVLSDARQPEVNLFSFNMPCRFQICIAKSLFS